MDEFIALVLSIVSGVIVSLVTLWLAGWQRARQERRTEERRREIVLAGIGRELQWNRIATRGVLDAGNAHYMVGRLSTVAFERHGSELATIAPDSVEPVFKHYSMIGTVREDIRDRASGHVAAQVVPDTRGETLHDFVLERTEEGSTVYTDEAAAYRGLPGRRHEAVKHSAGEYVRGMASTNGMESFWAMLRRGHDGTFHHFSEKHLDRYISEFSTRHNIRNADTADMMAIIAVQGVGRRLRYRDLIADNGLDSGARRGSRRSRQTAR